MHTSVWNPHRNRSRGAHHHRRCSQDFCSVSVFLAGEQAVSETEWLLWDIKQRRTPRGISLCSMAVSPAFKSNTSRSHGETQTSQAGGLPGKGQQRPPLPLRQRNACARIHRPRCIARCPSLRRCHHKKPKKRKRCCRTHNASDNRPRRLLSTKEFSLSSPRFREYK